MIRMAGYGDMDWLKALEARPNDPTGVQAPQDEISAAANALENAANAAFNLPVSVESRHEAVIRASKEIANKAADEMKFSAANNIKTKIANSGIDPVALGVTIREPNGVQRPITKEEWEGASDARWVEQIATAAALEYEKQVKRSWEHTTPAQNLSSSFDPETMRTGRIMSSTAANEDTCDRPHQTPANSASIFDPFKLDRFANADNSHDKSVASKRAADQERQDEKKAQYKYEDPGVEPMKQGHVHRSGGEDRDVFNQKAPRNQISMLDLNGTENLSPAQIKEKLSALFVAKIEDNGQKIKEANAKHKESIQRPKEPDRTWEQLQKPLSTSDLAKKLMEAFTCPPKPDGR